ncbi:MAG: IS66 family insertion sequence element accessory protein TnpB [Daejeonella sp.]
MFSLSSAHRYFLYQGYCDMRKSFDGLCGLVISELKHEVTSGEVFVFLNRQRTHIKLLHWEHGGFVLYYKRLEQGSFPHPKKQQLSWADLVLMIEGIQVQKSRQLRRFQM